MSIPAHIKIAFVRGVTKAAVHVGATADQAAKLAEDAEQSWESVSKFLATLMHSRTEAHMLHLMTKSFAAHKALNDYYDAVVGIVDDYAETFQGKYSVVPSYAVEPVGVEKGKAPLDWIMSLGKSVKDLRKKLPKDSELENIADEATALIDQTIYKLRELK